MAKWNNKDIKDLTNDELLTANKSLVSMHEFAESKKADPKFAEKFKSQPLPAPNPLFIELRDHINAEIETRKLTTG